MKQIRVIGLLFLMLLGINFSHATITQEWSHTLPVTSSGGFNHGATINGIYYVTNAYAPHYFTAINISTGEVVDYVLVNSGSGTSGQGGITVPIFTADYQYAWVSFGTPWGTDFVLSKIRLSDFTIVETVTGVDGTGVEEFAYDDTYFYTVEGSKISKRRLSDGLIEDYYTIVLPIGQGRTSGTLLVDDTLYYIGQGSVLMAINAINMTLSWDIELLGSSTYSYSTPSYDRETGLIYFGEGTTSNTGYFYAVNPETRTIVWDVAGSSCSFSSMHATCNNIIVAPCVNTGGNGYYYGINKTTGDIIWQSNENTGWKAPVCDNDFLYSWRNAGTNDFNKRSLETGNIIDTLAVGATSFCDSGNLVSDGEKYMYIGSGLGVRAFNLGSTTDRKNTWQHKGNDEYGNANYDININALVSQSEINQYYIKITLNIKEVGKDIKMFDLRNRLFSTSNNNIVNWNNLVWGDA